MNVKRPWLRARLGEVTMKAFVRVVQDLQAGVSRVLLFPPILNAVIVFLIFFLVLSLLDFHPWLSFFPALGYLAYGLYRKSRVNKIRLIEIYYPELNEKLRTAADHAEEEGLVIDDLHREVGEDVKRVYASSFFETGKNSTKIFFCILLCFLILFIASLNLPIDDFKMKLKNAMEEVTETISAGGSSFSGNSPTAGLGAGGELYGEKSMAELGNKEVELAIKPATFDLNIRNVNEAEELSFETRAFPEDAIISAADTYQDKIPEERQAIVKSYFQSLTKKN